MFQIKFAKLISSAALSAAVPSLALQAQGGVAGETTKPSASNAAKKEVLKDAQKSSGYLDNLMKVLGWAIVAGVVVLVCIFENKKMEQRKQIKRLKNLNIEDFERAKFYFLEESHKDLLDKLEQAEKNCSICKENSSCLKRDLILKSTGLFSIKCAKIALNDIYYSHEIHENIAIEKRLYPEKTEEEILKFSPDIKKLGNRLIKGKLIKENSWKKEIESCFDALKEYSTSVISVPENLEKLVKNNNFEDRTVWVGLQKFIQELSTIINKIENGEYELELKEKIQELDEKIKIEEDNFNAARDELFNRLTGKVEAPLKAKNLENTDHSNFADSTALVPYSVFNF